MSSGSFLHQPVLLQLTIRSLKVKSGETYLDCTVGSAGHALEIVKQGGKLYGLDVDPAALQRARERLSRACPDAFFHLEPANFSRLASVAQSLGLTSVAGILMDLGLSSEQLADETRGFSFQTAAPLDMRADPSLSVTAADLVNGLNQGELNDLFKKYGEEQHSLAIAAAIVRARRQQKISTTLDLVDIIKRAVPGRGKLHPATKVFQALRIAVNDELNSLKAALPQAVDLLKPQGRLVIITFHSLEDRLVKHFFKNQPHLKNLTKKPFRPTPDEIQANPRSRSAKLRVAEKI